MNTCKVAVVIPFKNFNRSLEKAVISVIKQNKVETKIYFIQNNCDGIRSFQFSDLLKNNLYYHEHLDVCANANVARHHGAAIAIADGFEFISFLDSDDEWYEEHLNIAIENIKRKQLDVHFSSFNVYDGAKCLPFANNYSGNLLFDLFIKKQIDCRSSCLVVTSQSYLLVSLDRNLNKHQDWGFAIDCVNAGRKIAVNDVITVQINTFYSGRMSGNVNAKSSIYFSEHKLQEPYKSTFLFSRLIESLSLQSISDYEMIINKIVFFQLNTSRMFTLLFLKLSKTKLAMKYSLVFSWYRKSFLVRNK